MGEHVFFICKWNQNLFLNVTWWGRRECILPISKACSFHDVTWIYPKNRVGRDVSSSHCAKAAFMGSILRLDQLRLFHPSWCMLRGCWCHLNTFATTSWWRPGGLDCVLFDSFRVLVAMTQGVGWVVINWILRVFWTSDLGINFLTLVLGRITVQPTLYFYMGLCWKMFDKIWLFQGVCFGVSSAQVPWK